MLTEAQTKNLKEQLIRHIESSFPEERKQFAISQIEAMDSEQLEEFLKKNKLWGRDAKAGHCVFCSIVSGEIKSYKIAENSKALAVLEINPLSRGHAIIIPKKHISSEEEMPKQVSSLVKKVSSLVKSRLKPKEIQTENSNVLGHEIINVIPIYGGELNEKRPATSEELEELKEALTKKSVIKVKKPLEGKPAKKLIEKFEELFWLPKRIP